MNKFILICFQIIFSLMLVFASSAWAGTGGIIGGSSAKWAEDKIVTVQICGATSNECEEKQYVLGQNQITRSEKTCMIDKGEAIVESRCINQGFILPSVVNEVETFLYKGLMIIDNSK